MDVTLRDGVRIHLEDKGKGDPLLLLHGFTGSYETWRRPIIDSLCRTFRVLAVDLPGHGLSDAPIEPDRYRLPDILFDLLEVLDVLELQRATWVGYSMGGRLALGAAAYHPERVDRLILESASPGLRSDAEKQERRRSDEDLAQRLLRDGIGKFTDTWMALPLFRTQLRLDARIRDEERERRLKNNPVALAACLRGLGTGSQPSLWDDLPRFHLPVLVMAGAEDDKYSTLAHEMFSLLPRASLAIIPAAGHTVHLEQPSAWLESVENFLIEYPASV